MEKTSEKVMRMPKRATAIALILALMAGALLAGAAPQGGGFSDVPAGAWYYDVVEQMALEGLIQGYGDGSFRPGAALTAAEFVTILARITGLEARATQVAHWAGRQMQAALEAGWYDWDELPSGAEAYNAPLTRQLAVKILMKALLPQATGLYSDWAERITDFGDLDGRYYEAVFAAYAAGVLQGDEQGRLLPGETMTRAQACAMVMRAQGKAEPQPPPQAVTAVAGGVSENGWLQVKGTQLCNEGGEPVRLTGMSTHGMQWYGGFASAGAMADLAGRGANLIRIAMYTGEGGYIGNEAAMTDRVVQAVDAAIAQDLYVIIDWHILSDGDPATHQAQAVTFFGDMARRYGEYPNVLYEICNEPNGNVTWQADIKPYAQAVIPAIREHAPQAVIIVGTGTWSQDVDAVAAGPLQGDNLMYTLHFFAATHGQALRQKAEKALAAGTPLFVTEWGTCEASGNGRVDLEESRRWLDFMALHGLSWANWSLCDKAESASALRPGAARDGGWQAGDLTPSGAFVFKRFGK